MCILRLLLLQIVNDKKALEQQNSEEAREIVDRQQERGR